MLMAVPAAHTLLLYGGFFFMVEDLIMGMFFGK